MISARATATAWTLVLLTVLPASAQEPAPIERPGLDALECLPAPPEGDLEILRLWRARGAALAAGNDGEADRVLGEMRAHMQRSQIDRLPALSAALLVESERQLQEGNHGKAHAAAKGALALDPTSSRARLQLARTAWRSGNGVFRALGFWIGPGKAVFSTFWGSYGFVVNLAIVVALALAAVGALFSLALLFRYGSPFVHDSMERLPGRWSEASRRLVGRGVLFLPLTVFVGGAWILLWLPAILVRSATRAERVLAGLLLLALVGSGPALVYLDRSLAAGMSPTARILASDDARAPALAIGEMRRLAAREPDVAAYHFLLADLYADQIQGSQTSAADETCFLLAEAEYQEAIRLAPDEVRFRINLGNLYVRNGSYREAWRRYQEALDIAPNTVLAAYDLAAAYSEDVNRLEDRERMFDRAREMDAGELARLMEVGRGSDVIDARLTFGEMRRRILAEAGDADTQEGGLSAGFRRPTSIAGFIAALVVAATFLLLGARPGQRCSRCGRPFCHRCKTDPEGLGYCAQCLHIFLRRDGVAPDVREKKTREIDRHERRQKVVPALVRLVLPGLDGLLTGRTMRGFLVLLVWTGGLLWLLAASRLLVLPNAPVAALDHGGRGALIALALVWILGNRPRGLRHRSRGRA